MEKKKAIEAMKVIGGPSNLNDVNLTCAYVKVTAWIHIGSGSRKNTSEIHCHPCIPEKTGLVFEDPFLVGG